MFKVLNKYNQPINILHFQGKNIFILKKTINKIYNTPILGCLDEDITILTTFTNKNNAILAKQLDLNNISYINSIPNNYDISQQWYMPNKIKFIIDALENKIQTNIVIILDGYDVLFTSFIDIKTKFINQKYQILFNSSHNNYPNETIDIIPNRYYYDDFMPYLNAGCCIGYKDALLQFYKECYEYINIPNELNSEQKIVRYAFAQYSNNLNQNFIWVDFKRNIFQTMGMTKINYNAYTDIMKINDNKLNII